MANINTLLFKLIVDTSKGTASIRKVGSAIDKTARQGTASMSKLGRAFDGVAKVSERIFFLFSSFRMVKNAIVGLIEKSNAQEIAERKVEQAVKSTGMAAGFTADQLKNMAAQLQTVTTYGDEEILNKVTTQLLTFTNITGEQFKKAQEAVLDLSTVLNGDLQAAAIMVGKALNDPVATLGQLTRAGIQFDKEQKKLIKTLWETGQKAKAQEMILKELNKEFGGQAKAMANLPAGKLKQFSNLVGDLKEKLGDLLKLAIIPFVMIMKPIVEFLNKMDRALFQFITTLLVLIATGIKVRRMLLAWNTTIKILGVSIKSALGWIGIFIAAAGLIYEAWANNLGGFQKYLRIAFEYLKWFINYGVELIKGYVRLVKDYFGAVGQIIIAAFTFDIGKIKTALQNAKNVMIHSVLTTGIEMQRITEQRNKNIQAIKDEFANKEIESNKLKNLKVEQDDKKSAENRIQITAEMVAQRQKLLERLRKFASMNEFEKQKYMTKVNKEEVNKRTQILIDFEGEVEKLQGKQYEAFKETQEKEKEEFRTTREQMLEYERAFQEGFLETAQGYAELLAEQRQMKYQDEINRLQSEMNARRQYLKEELKQGKISEAEYKARLKRLNQEEERRTKQLDREAHKRSAIEKAVAVTNILINTYDMAVKAYDAVVGVGGPVLAAIAAAAATAFGMAQLAAVESIKAYAKGGYVDKPTFALLGEAGPEIVAPEKDFKQVINNMNTQNNQVQTVSTEKLSAIQIALNEIKERLGSLELRTEISGEDLAIVVQNGQNNLAKGEING